MGLHDKPIFHALNVVNDLQCTIVWHVDDLKISHKDRAVMDDVIRNLDSEFGKESLLTKTRRKRHDCLGMVIDFSTTGSVEISVRVAEIINEDPQDMDGKAPTPAANHHFAVNEKDPTLSESEAQCLHHIVAKLLFLSKARYQVFRQKLFSSVKNPGKNNQKSLLV